MGTNTEVFILLHRTLLYHLNNSHHCSGLWLGLQWEWSARKWKQC